jgi:hypothetical protein
VGWRTEFVRQTCTSEQRVNFRTDEQMVACRQLLPIYMSICLDAGGQLAVEHGAWCLDCAVAVCLSVCLSVCLVHNCGIRLLSAALKSKCLVHNCGDSVTTCRG